MDGELSHFETYDPCELLRKKLKYRTVQGSMVTATATDTVHHTKSEK